MGTAKSEGENNNDMHSTSSSRNDRFKVVKIASLLDQPFRRGRWKCMDFVDENLPLTFTTSQQSMTDTKSSSNLPQIGSQKCVQTQSLSQQNVQKMLVQSAFAVAATNPPQFYQNVPSQIPAPQSTQLVFQSPLPIQTCRIQSQFIAANQQQYYFPSPNVAPHSSLYTNWTNFQYVPPSVPIQNQSIPQNINPQIPPSPLNFQQGESYAASPSAPGAFPQPLVVNGHAYPSTSSANNLVPPRTQVAENVLLSTHISSAQQINQQPIEASFSLLPPQSQMNVVVMAVPPNPQYNQAPHSKSNQPPVVNNPPQQNITHVVVTPSVAISSTTITPVSSAQLSMVNSTVPTDGVTKVQLAPSVNLPVTTTTTTSTVSKTTINVNLTPISHLIPSTTHPQFVTSVNRIPTGAETTLNAETNATIGTDKADGQDHHHHLAKSTANLPPAKNAIDNKIEQAMDLVKIHLMYTVREEVDVLKEKIVELMERIQQLESENNFLKQQIQK